MGKGLARQVAYRWPDCVEPYREACRRKTLRAGTVLVWHRPDGGYLFQAPTKVHWREQSTIKLVAQTIDALYHEAVRLQVTSLHLPPLGCGLGGLSWPKDIEPLVREAAQRHPQLQTVIHLINH